MCRGYIKFWRRTLDSEIWKNQKLFRFWTYCLLKATHQPIVSVVGYQNIDLLPGQFIFGRKKAAKETSLSEREIRTCLDYLIKSQNLTSKTTNHYTILTVVNWGIYQSKENANDQQTTSKRPATLENSTNKTTSNKKILTIEKSRTYQIEENTNGQQNDQHHFSDLRKNDHIQEEQEEEYKEEEATLPKTTDAPAKLKKPKYDASCDAVIPDVLNTDKFRKVWGEWCEYRRKEKRNAIGQQAAKMQLAKLAEYGEDIAIATIHKSIENSWQGIFPEKFANAAPRGEPQTLTVEQIGEMVKQEREKIERIKNGFYNSTNMVK